MAKKTLAGIELLATLGDAGREQLEQRCSWRRFQTGEHIIERGARDRDVYFIVEGAVRIVDFAPTGRELTFARAGAGATFGELAAIDGQPRATAVVAAADSLIAILGHEPFLEMLENHGRIGLQLLRQMAAVVRRGNERALELNNLEVTERIYRQLLDMAHPHETVANLWVIEPLPPLREIARRVHSSPNELNAVLSQLYPSGLLRRQGESLYLMDIKALRDLLATAKAAASGGAQAES